MTVYMTPAFSPDAITFVFFRIYDFGLAHSVKCMEVPRDPLWADGSAF